MGDNTISTAIDGTIIQATDVNQYKTALTGDLLPRESTGQVSANSGSLGESDRPFKFLHVTGGHWSVGDIKYHHSYDGLAPVGEGWMLCDGRIINETNYDAEHGVGSWAEYIQISVLGGKYLPNLVSRYPVGTSSTSQDGDSPITSVGNSGNEASFSHEHQVYSHNHQWYDTDWDTNSGYAVPSTLSYTENGGETHITKVVAVQPLVGGQNVQADSASGKDYMTGEYFTDKQAPFTTTGLDSVSDIQPESIEMQVYMRII